jgi:hypothetical protein
MNKTNKDTEPKTSATVTDAKVTTTSTKEGET